MKDGPSTGTHVQTPQPWSRFAYWATILALGAIDLAYFLPSMAAGIQGQDTALDAINGYGIYHGLTRFSEITRALAAIELQQGGWLPLKGLVLAFWSLEPSPLLVRGLQALVVTCDLLLFATLLARQWRSLYLGVAASVGALLAMQLHKSHDAILDSSLTIPLSFAFMLVTYLSFSSYTEERRWQTFMAAMFSLSVASTLDESAWILSLGLPILAFSGRTARATGLSLLLIPGACVCLTLISQYPPPISLRWLANPTLSDLERASLQLVGALPMVYREFGHVPHYNGVAGETDTRFWNIPPINIIGQLLTLAVSFGVFAITTALELPSRKPSLQARTPMSLGILFAACSFVLVDPKIWRAGIALGEATNATFFGCFAFGIAFAYILMIAIKSVESTRAKPALAPLLALTVGLIMYGNVRLNAMIVQIDQARYEPLRLLKQSSKAGFFQALPPLSVLALDGDFSLSASPETDLNNLKYLFSSLVGRKQEVASLSDLATLRDDCSASTLQGCSRRSVWILRVVHQGPGRGGLLLARWTGSGLPSILIDRATIFQDESGFQPDLWGVTDIAGPGIKIISRDDDAGLILTRIARTCGPVPIAMALFPNRTTIAMGDGFLPGSQFRYYQFAEAAKLETRLDGQQDWHYVTATSRLRVYADGCGTARTAQLEADVYAPGPSTLDIKVGANVTRMNVSEYGTHVDVPLRLGINPDLEETVTFHTDAPAAHEELMLPPFSHAKFPQAHLLINNLTISDAPTHD